MEKFVLLFTVTLVIGEVSSQIGIDTIKVSPTGPTFSNVTSGTPFALFSNTLSNIRLHINGSEHKLCFSGDGFLVLWRVNESCVFYEKHLAYVAVGKDGEGNYAIQPQSWFKNYRMEQLNLKFTVPEQNDTNYEVYVAQLPGPDETEEPKGLPVPSVLLQSTCTGVYVTVGICVLLLLLLILSVTGNCIFLRLLQGRVSFPAIFKLHRATSETPVAPQRPERTHAAPSPPTHTPLTSSPSLPTTLAPQAPPRSDLPPHAVPSPSVPRAPPVSRRPNTQSVGPDYDYVTPHEVRPLEMAALRKDSVISQPRDGLRKNRIPVNVPTQPDDDDNYIDFGSQGGRDAHYQPQPQGYQPNEGVHQGYQPQNDGLHQGYQPNEGLHQSYQPQNDGLHQGYQPQNDGLHQGYQPPPPQGYQPQMGYQYDNQYDDDSDPLYGNVNVGR